MLPVACLGMVAGLTSCGEAKPVVTISQISWGFVDDDTKQLTQDITLYPEHLYQLRYSFSLSINKDVSEAFTLGLVVEYGNVDVIDGTLNVANGSFQPIDFVDTEGNNNRKGTMSITLPKTAGQFYSSGISLNYRAKQFGSTNTRLNFDNTSNKYDLDGEGKDGITKGLDINKIKLVTPSASFNNSTGVLQWRQVDKATSYKISIDGTFANDISNNQIIVNVPSETLAGDPISYDLSNVPALSDHQAHLVRVKAYSSNINYDESNFSEGVSVQIAGA